MVLVLLPVLGVAAWMLPELLVIQQLLRPLL